MNRTKKHPEWVFVRAYQKLNNYSDMFMATHLGISVRTYTDKIGGWSDFSKLEADELQRLFNVSKDELFLIKNVSNRNIAF